MSFANVLPTASRQRFSNRFDRKGESAGILQGARKAVMEIQNLKFKMKNEDGRWRDPSSLR